MSKYFIKKQNGMTIVELLVSMGIFAVVMTITVGFFITMQKMQMLYRDRANLQQEGRIASEIFSRYVREAKAISYSGSDLCVGGNPGLTLTMLNGNILKFKCEGSTPNRLRMCASPSTCTVSNDFSDISSGQIHIRSLTINRGTATYPKTLRYNLEVNQLDASGNVNPSPGEGEKIMFPGYLVMRNEL